jgi:hypothetical protein
LSFAAQRTEVTARVDDRAIDAIAQQVNCQVHRPALNDSAQVDLTASKLNMVIINRETLSRIGSSATDRAPTGDLVECAVVPSLLSAGSTMGLKSPPVKSCASMASRQAVATAG